MVDTPRRKRRIGRAILIVIAVLVAIVAIGTPLVQSMAPFGGEMSGERLARARANPHYRDGRFVNPLPPAPYTFAYVRDLLHVGTGIWVLGWPYWHEPALPVALVAAALLGVLAMPALARRWAAVARILHSISDREERWSGIALYTLAYAVLTGVGLGFEPFPAAAALWALSLGDGLGGAAGRRYGRHRYRLPWGKEKSLEGSAVCGEGRPHFRLAAAERATHESDQTESAGRCQAALPDEPHGHGTLRAPRSSGSMPALRTCSRRLSSRASRSFLRLARASWSHVIRP